MKLALILVVSLFLVAKVAVAAPSTIPIPIVRVLLVPIDGERYITAAQAAAVFEAWSQAERVWLQAQTGKTYDLAPILVVRSPHNLLYFGAGDLDACGEAAKNDGDLTLREAYIAAGLGESPRNARVWVVALGHGGFAGANWYRKEDFGWGMVGDHGVAYASGTLIPCFEPQKYSDSGGFVIESLHAMGVDSEVPVRLELGSTMTASQIRDFRNKNRAFLR